MSRIEIHQHVGNVWLDVLLPDGEASREKLQMLDALLEVLGEVPLDTLYPDCGTVTLRIAVDSRGESYVVLAEDGREIDGDRGGLSSLADRIQQNLTTDYFIVNP